MKRVCPKRFLLFLSLVSPSCNFLLRPRQGQHHTHRRGSGLRWPRERSSEGFTDSADEGRRITDLGLQATRVQSECVGGCVFSAVEGNPQLHNGNDGSPRGNPPSSAAPNSRWELSAELKDRLLNSPDDSSNRSQEKRTLSGPVDEDGSHSSRTPLSNLQDVLTLPRHNSVIHYASRTVLPQRKHSSESEILRRNLLDIHPISRQFENDMDVGSHSLTDGLLDHTVFHERLAETSEIDRDMSSFTKPRQNSKLMERKFSSKPCDKNSRNNLDLESDFLLRRLCEAVTSHPELSNSPMWRNRTSTGRWRGHTEHMRGRRLNLNTDHRDTEQSIANLDTSDTDGYWDASRGPGDVNKPPQGWTERQIEEDAYGKDRADDNILFVSPDGVSSADDSDGFETDERFQDVNPFLFPWNPDPSADNSVPQNHDVHVDTPPEPTVETVAKRRGESKDKKVFVYGQDDRLRVFLSQMRKFPFSNIARLSTGCTGTLVTPKHVLTAAHCVHNGLDFRSNLEMLKIEIPDTMGFRTYYAQKISVPTGWLRETDSNAINQSGRHAAYDYAVVRLKLAVAGRNRFLPLAVPRADVLTLDIHFLAFPESDHGMWRSVCPASAHMARMDGNLILTRCDAAVGNSGAAVFTNEAHEGMRVVGVLSNTMHVAHHRSFDRYSIITALTWPKLTDICRQLGSLAQQYNVCPPFRYMRIAPPPVRLNAIPFFGKRTTELQGVK